MSEYNRIWENDPRAKAARNTADKIGGAYSGYHFKEANKYSSWWLVLACAIMAFVFWKM